jgi:hypothetical protein
LSFLDQKPSERIFLPETGCPLSAQNKEEQNLEVLKSHWKWTEGKAFLKTFSLFDNPTSGRSDQQDEDDHQGPRQSSHPK